MKRFVKYTIKFKKNLVQSSFRNLYTSTKFNGSYILNHSKVRDSNDTNVTMECNHNDNCLHILQLMNKNDEKYVNIIDSNNNDNIISYKDVSDICLLNDWLVAEDLKQRKESVVEK